MFGFLSGLGKVAGGIGTLLGATKKKEKQPTPRENILSQAQGARDAADEYGFNPLTLLQYGQPGGASPIAGGGGTPPLASIEAITGGLMDINDVVSGDAARRRAAEQAQLDLAQIKLDQAQSGVIAAGPGVSGVGQGPAVLGRNAIPAPTMGGAVHARKFGMGENPIAPGRERETDPLVNSPGVFELENEWTGGGPITIPGDGEPWGFDEFGTVGAVGAPQVMRNMAQREIREVVEARDDPEKQKELREKKMNSIFRHPPGWAGVLSRASSIFN